MRALPFTHPIRQATFDAADTDCDGLLTARQVVVAATTVLGADTPHAEGILTDLLRGRSGLGYGGYLREALPGAGVQLGLDAARHHYPLGDDGGEGAIPLVGYPSFLDVVNAAKYASRASRELEVAASDVHRMSDVDVAHLRSLRRPKPALRTLVRALRVLLGEGGTKKKRSWKASTSFLVKSHFMGRLLELDAGGLSPGRHRRLAPYMNDPDLDAGVLGVESRAAGVLCRWLHAVYTHANVHASNTSRRPVLPPVHFRQPPPGSPLSSCEAKTGGSSTPSRSTCGSRRSTTSLPPSLTSGSSPAGSSASTRRRRAATVDSAESGLPWSDAAASPPSAVSSPGLLASPATGMGDTLGSALFSLSSSPSPSPPRNPGPRSVSFRMAEDTPAATGPVLAALRTPVALLAPDSSSDSTASTSPPSAPAKPLPSTPTRVLSTMSPLALPRRPCTAAAAPKAVPPAINSDSETCTGTSRPRSESEDSSLSLHFGTASAGVRSRSPSPRRPRPASKSPARSTPPRHRPAPGVDAWVAPGDGSDPLTAVLASLRLLHYKAALRVLGVECVEDLADLDGDMLDDIAMPPVQKKRLLRACGGGLPAPRPTIVLEDSGDAPAVVAVPPAGAPFGGIASPSPVAMSMSPDRRPRSPDGFNKRGVVSTRPATSPMDASPVHLPSPAPPLPEDGVHTLYTASLAVYVGINRYSHPSMSSLRCAVADALALEATMREQHGFETVALLLDAEATKGGIERAFDALAARLGERKQARLLFYFAGHGIRSGSAAYLCPYEARREAPMSTCLNLGFVSHYASQFSAMHQLYILDACHSGGLFTLSRANTLWGLHMACRPAIQGMTAVTESEDALESAGRGLFSRTLVEGLQGGAFPTDASFVTASALFHYVQEGVFYQARAKGGVQTPQLGKVLPRHKGVSCDGEFLFFRLAVPAL